MLTRRNLLKSLLLAPFAAMLSKLPRASGVTVIPFKVNDLTITPAYEWHEVAMFDGEWHRKLFGLSGGICTDSIAYGDNGNHAYGDSCDPGQAIGRGSRG